MFESLVEPAELAFHVAEVIKRGREVRTQPESMLVPLDGLVTQAHALERQAEVGDGLGIIGSQADGSSAAPGGALVLTDGAVRFG